MNGPSLRHGAEGAIIRAKFVITHESRQSDQLSDFN